MTNGNVEAVYVNFTASGANIASSGANLTTAIANYVNTFNNATSNATTASGADALFVVATNDGQTLVYSYLDTNSVVQAADFSAIAAINGVAETYVQAQASFILA